MTNFKNLLVQYKGGGWDGCFWEWNYFMFDSNGKWQNIIHNGRKGIDNAKDALELLNDASKNDWPTRPDYYTYDLGNKESIEEFQNECSEEHIFGVVTIVNHITKSKTMYWTCDSCEEKQYPSAKSPKMVDVYDGYMHHTGYHGNGGISVQMDGAVCSDCYCNNSCGHCGEYVGSYDDSDAGWAEFSKIDLSMKSEEVTEKAKEKYKEVDENDGPLCQCCMESEVKEAI